MGMEVFRVDLVISIVSCFCSIRCMRRIELRICGKMEHPRTTE